MCVKWYFYHFIYFETSKLYNIKGTYMNHAVIKNIFLISVGLWFVEVEATLDLDTDSNHINPSQDRVTMLSGIIYEVEGPYVFPSHSDDTTGATSHACWYLSKTMNLSPVHYPLTENYLDFIGFLSPQPHQEWMIYIRYIHNKPIIQIPHHPPSFYI